MCYDLERFVDQKTASEFICPICTNVLCCPQKGKNGPQSKQEITKNADGHIYCECCIKNALKYSQNCPECRRSLTVDNLQPLNRILSNLLKCLKIQCKYKKDGCEHMDELESIENHELNCEFGVKNCPNCEAIVSHKGDHTDIDCITFKLGKIIENKEAENEKLKEENRKLHDRILEKNQQIAKLTSEIKTLKSEPITERNQSRELIQLCRVSENNFAKIKQLIENYQVDVNNQDRDGCSAIVYASREGHLNVVKLLIQNGANVNNEDNFGCNSLSGAAAYGHLTVSILLIENGAIVNNQSKSGHTALMNASREGYLDIVKLLVESGAEVNLTNERGETALSIALYKSHDEVAEYLRSKGAV